MEIRSKRHLSVQNTLSVVALFFVSVAAAQLKTPAPPSLDQGNAASAEDTSRVVDALTILKGIQVFYSNAQDFHASFTQTFTYKVYGRKKVSSGKVFFKKPGKMRWDYEAPTPRLFIADGTVLWVYEPEEAQVFKRQLATAQLPVALRFLKGEGDLSQEFNYSTPIKGEGTFTLALTPKRPSGEYTRLELTVDQETFEVKASALIDPTGNTNHIQFSGVKVNEGLPEAGFKFTPPKGVRIITE